MQQHVTRTYLWSTSDAFGMAMVCAVLRGTNGDRPNHAHTHAAPSTAVTNKRSCMQHAAISSTGADLLPAAPLQAGIWLLPVAQLMRSCYSSWPGALLCCTRAR